MEKISLWFSHREDRYDAELKEEQKKIHRHFQLLGKSQIWDWDNCTVSWVKTPNKKIRIIIRSSKITSSEYQKKQVKIRYMLGFDVDPSDVNEPVEESYQANIDNLTEEKGPTKIRWTINFRNNYSIWQWKDEVNTKEASEIYKIFKEITLTQEQPSLNNTFKVDLEDEDDGISIIPVVYQPAIDSWKNFLREVHCHRINDNRYEVTLLFNGEELREHVLLNPLYRWFRSWRYSRTVDVETFNILLSDEIPEVFDFSPEHYTPIYSGEKTVENDDVHIDKPDVKIKYYFVNPRHPIVFVNTANHAMAEHDTNHRIWKWEYVGWGKEKPIVFGHKSRKQIDRSFKAKLNFW